MKAPGGIPCLKEEELATFLHGEPSAEEVARVDMHIDTCSACHELIMALGRPASPAAAPRDATRARAPAPAPVRGSSVGRYLVIDQIGAGGMGVVYAAFDPELGRKVALKLLRSDLIEQGSARLQREAKLLARLSHPNVVALHDVGVYGDQVFIVMESIDGVTLSEWLAAPRPFRARLELLLQAGRGLQAAHAAGLVHRDFKPSNVLVDGEGRARVLDFGLACAVGGAGAGGAEAALPERLSGAMDPPIAFSLTHSGMLVGTPAYMAPEQYRGGSVDARADQWSFCVVLYEALYGQLPFAGASLEELASAITGGRVRLPPKERAIPRRVYNALLRGLRADPAERFASMDVLMAALVGEAHPYRLRIGVALGGLALLTAGMAEHHYSGRKELARCASEARTLESAWDATRQRAVKDAFAAGGKPYADAAWHSVSRYLDEYVARWHKLRMDSCQAASGRGAQKEELFELRTKCLDEHLNEAAALTSLLTHADGAMIEQAVQAVYQLPPIRECEDVRALIARSRPPRDAAQRAELESLRGELSMIKALSRGGRYTEGSARVAALLPRAKQLGYVPLLAEALFNQGKLEWLRGEFEPALRDSREALWEATAVAEDEIAFAAAMQLMRIFIEKNLYSEAELSLSHAQSLLRRLGSGERLLAELCYRRGILSFKQRRFPQAQTDFQRSLDIWTRILPPGDPSRVFALDGMAKLASEGGDHARALSLYQQMLALSEVSLGSQHPTVATAEQGIGEAMMELGQESAIVHLRRCLEICKAALPPVHPATAAGHGMLGVALSRTGHSAEAEEHYKEALRISEQVFGRAHILFLTQLGNLGVLYFEQGKLSLAARYLEEALQLAKHTLGEEDTFIATMQDNRAQLSLRLGELTRARALERAALSVFERDPKAAPGLRADALMTLGEACLRLGQPAEAVLALERAAALRRDFPEGTKEEAARALAKAQALLERARSQRAPIHKPLAGPDRSVLRAHGQ